MIIREENMDLFAVPQGYYLAHCITEDFSLGRVICIDNVYNLVLKKKPSKKAKYKKLRSALEDMLENMDENLVTKIAMPKIGCGHEGLEWERVKEIIEEVFEDTDIEILVCSL